MIPADSIPQFPSEMVGAAVVKGIDPRTGHRYHVFIFYIDQVSGLSAADKKKIFEDNAKKVYPRRKGKI